METSSNGIRFIACREAFVSVAYVDGEHADGSPKYSIGFGSQDPPPKQGDTISLADGIARLKTNIAHRDSIISTAIKVPITQHAFDATSSLYYQSGTLALRRVADLFNQGKPVFAIAAFIHFNHGADSIPTDGHTKRRIREMIMGIDGYYGDLSQVAFFDGDPRKMARQFMALPENI